MCKLKITSAICIRQPDISKTLEGSKTYYVLIASDSENWKTICMLRCLRKPFEELSSEPMKIGVLIHLKNGETKHLIKRCDKHNVKRFLFQAIIIAKYNLPIIWVSKARQWKCLQIICGQWNNIRFLRLAFKTSWCI